MTSRLISITLKLRRVEMIIGYKDVVTNSVLSDITGSGSFEPGAPLENAKDRRLMVLARRANLGSVLIRSVFTQDETIGIVSILGHNFPPGTNLGITLQDSGGSLIADSGTVLLPQYVGDYNFPRHYYYIFQQNYTGVRRVIFNIHGVPIYSIYPEIGRLWAGPYFSPARTTSVSDFEMQCRDNSVVNTSNGGQAYSDYRGRYRQLNCSLNGLTEIEAIGDFMGLEAPPNIQDIAFYVGRAGNVIIIPVTTNNSSGQSFQVIHKFGVYGHFLEPPSLRLLSARSDRERFYTTSLQVIEEL